jgi:hypothetical protein
LFTWEVMKLTQVSSIVILCYHHFCIDCLLFMEHLLLLLLFCFLASGDFLSFYHIFSSFIFGCMCWNMIFDVNENIGATGYLLLLALNFWNIYLDGASHYWHATVWVFFRLLDKNSPHNKMVTIPRILHAK